MPRFFIDTDDGRTALVDEDGYLLPDARAARDLAIRALLDMTRGDMVESDRRAFSAQVRAEDGSTLYRAGLTLTGEWSIEPPAP